MEFSIGNIVLIAVYFLVVFGIGFWVKRKESVQEYLIAGRKVGVLQTAASISAVIGGLILVTQAALSFELGVAAFWFWVGSALGFVVLGLVVKKIKVLADKESFLTLSDYLFSKFDYKCGILAAIIIFVALFSLLVAQFIAAGSLFSPLLGIDYSIAVIIMGVGTLFYLLLGGFKAVIKTDFLQFLLMIGVFLFVILNIGKIEFSKEQLDIVSIGVPVIIAYLLIGVFAIFSAADVWQRIFASKDYKTARKAFFVAAIFFLIFGAALTVIGMSAKINFPEIAANEAFYYGIFQLVPAPLLGIVIIGVLAAIMSTIDTELFYLSSSVSKDFIHRRKKLSDNEIRKYLRYFLVLITALAAVTAIFFNYIIEIIFGVISLLMAISPAVFASLFWKIKNNAAFLSLLGGVLGFAVIVVTGNFTPENSIITLPAAIVFLIIGQIVFKRKTAEVA